MAKQKIDGVVEAVRYNPNGQIRSDFIAQLKSGKRFLVGRRVTYLGGTFETAQQIQLAAKNGGEIIVAGNTSTDHDHLEGVPIL